MQIDHRAEILKADVSSVSLLNLVLAKMRVAKRKAKLLLSALWLTLETSAFRISARWQFTLSTPFIFRIPFSLGNKKFRSGDAMTPS